MKRFGLAIMVIAAFSVAGCQAFNDTSSEPNANVSELPTGALSNVTVKSNESPVLSTNSGWTTGETGTDYSVTVEEVADLTNKVTVTNEDGVLTFTILEKEVASLSDKDAKVKSHLVMEASYTDADKRLYELVRGTVVVDRFNVAGEAGEVINAGGYTFLFKAAGEEKAEAKAAALVPVTEVATDEVATEEATAEAAAPAPALGEVTLQGVYYATAVKAKEADAAKAMSVILK